MHSSSQSQIAYLCLGISSPGFACWREAKAGADTWLIKCLSTMLTAVPEGHSDVLMDFASAQLYAIAAPIRPQPSAFEAQVSRPSGEGLFLSVKKPRTFLALFQILYGWSLESASPKAFCPDQNSRWPLRLDFQKGVPSLEDHGEI